MLDQPIFAHFNFFLFWKRDGEKEIRKNVGYLNTTRSLLYFYSFGGGGCTCDHLSRSSYEAWQISFCFLRKLIHLSCMCSEIDVHLFCNQIFISWRKFLCRGFIFCRGQRFLLSLRWVWLFLTCPSIHLPTAGVLWSIGKGVTWSYCGSFFNTIIMIVP